MVGDLRFRKIEELEVFESREVTEPRVGDPGSDEVQMAKAVQRLET